MKTNYLRYGEQIGRWIGRIMAVALFLFWGAFFVEHLWEWFLRPGEGLPPARVWLGQALHGLMLVGLMLMLKWERFGVTVLVVATTAFFASIGYRGFPYLALINLVPVVALAACWSLRQATRPAH